MTEHERIKAARKSFNLSQAEFGRRLGVSRDVINNLEQARVEIKDYMRKLICSEYEISEDWLITGEGEMFAPMSKDEEFHQVLTDIEFSGDDFIKDLLYTYWNLDDNEKAAIRKLISGLNGGK